MNVILLSGFRNLRQHLLPCDEQAGRNPDFLTGCLLFRECMSIPKGWLCYLAPEIMQNLRVRGLNEDLPFTKASDVYAFGTIWFELLTGEWPWKLQPPETVIWSVGRGVRPTLANLQV